MSNPAKPAVASGPRRPASWWDRVGLWQGFAFACFVVAFAFGVTLFGPRTERPAEPVVVVLAGQDAKPVIIASAERGSRYLTLKAVAPVAPAPDRALELWMLPEGGHPRSLGLIPASGVGRIALQAPVGIALQNIPALAVSLEPAGGSRTREPTGPFLYSGAVQLLY